MSGWHRYRSVRALKVIDLHLIALDEALHQVCLNQCLLLFGPIVLLE